MPNRKAPLIRGYPQDLDLDQVFFASFGIFRM